jgi:hypothetical protein
MSLAELIPALRSLSRDEQLELKLFLDSELAKPQETNATGPCLDPESDLGKQFIAAATLYRERVEVAPEGIAVLQQLLADLQTKAR